MHFSLDTTGSDNLTGYNARAVSVDNLKSYQNPTTDVILKTKDKSIQESLYVEVVWYFPIRIIFSIWYGYPS
jgi:hypothetical protein